MRNIPILDFLFPKRCSACVNLLTTNESLICTACRNELPVLDATLFTPQLLQQFFGKESVVAHFSSLLNFEKQTEVQELLHNLKYKGHQKLGEVLGHWHARLLKNNSSFEAIDLVIPMPIHKSRLRKRGYNQVAFYAKTLAINLNASYHDDILLKSRYQKSQVFLNRKERFTNIVNSIYISNKSVLNNKHILLVDDIITTGATMRACVSYLKHTNCKISIASIALALGDSI